MKIGTMRNIDFYAGRLIVFFLSITNNFFKKKLKNNELKNNNILFIKTAEMGAIVLSFPAVKYIKDKYPEANLYFLTLKENTDALRLFNVILQKNFLTIRTSSFYFLFIDTLKILKVLINCKFDIVYNFDIFTRYSLIITYLSLAPRRYGFTDKTKKAGYLGSLLTDTIDFEPHIHISQNFYKLVSGGSLPRDIQLPKIISSKESLEKIKLKLCKEGIDNLEGKKIILFNPNASSIIPIRKWSIENFILLVNLLLKYNPSIYIIIIGTILDRPDAVILKNQVADCRVIDFTGKTCLEELVDLFNMSHSLVTNDSGPAHFASLTNIKIFDIFGPESPEIFGPLSHEAINFYSKLPCSPCISVFNQKKVNCKNTLCLKMIDAKDVYNKMIEYLQ